MLNLEFVRTDMPESSSSRKATSEDAMRILINCYLGWGAHIVEVTPMKIHVAAKILGHIDNMIITGNDVDEMSNLRNVIELWKRSLNEKGDGIEQALASPLMENASTPLLMEMVSGLAVGEARLENFKNFISKI